jgi:uncharacterized cupredoxin-like copper-binding protein
MPKSKPKLLSPVAAMLPVTAMMVVLAAPAGVAMAANPVPDALPAQPITVVATDYDFAPAKLIFKRGIAYRLHIENHGKEMHEFNAPAFFKSVELGDPQALNADRTEIAVHPGEAKDLAFVPRQAGQFRLICPDHDWTGMVGEITVE